MKFTRRTSAVGLAALVAATVVASGAAAYVPQGAVLYELPSGSTCLKGTGNCVIYPKSAELPSGRIVAAFEKSTTVDYGDGTTGANGQTIPVWKSDDDGVTWQPLTEVASPAELSSDPAHDAYTSNWTNPYLYVMPETVGSIAAGTLLLSTVVSGEDEFYREHKAADPNWIPNNDGDRRDVALALYSSVDDGATWSFVNIIATGGWQGGSAGAGGVNIADANVHRQIDPVWEPHLDVIGGQLVTFYSDENDYIGMNPTTGVPILDPANDTAPDSGAQILVHKTWDGVSADWSAPVVDVEGGTFAWNGGTQIGGGRPGMTTIAHTAEDQYLLTYEYWGGGANIRYRVSDDPLRFFDNTIDAPIDALPVSAGSGSLAQGGSPVLVQLPDGRILYNAAGSGNIWVNESASLSGPWTEYQTTLGGGYSRNLQLISATGKVLIMQAVWGGAGATPVIRHADVDLGQSVGEYYRIENSATGQVIGTGGNVTDANIGNGDAPDVRLENWGASTVPSTQLWHLEARPGGTVSLLNKSGGRAASVWTGNATAGQQIGQWVDNTATGQWTVVDQGDGTVKFRSTANSSLYLTGTGAGQQLTLQASTGNGTQNWTVTESAEPTVTVQKLVNAHSGKCLDVNAWSTADGGNVQQWTCGGGANQGWRLESLSGGYVQVVNVHSGKCLDVNGVSTANGGNVQQWTCTGATNQQWTVEPSGSGSQLVARHSGKCLDVNAWSSADGANVQQWTCGGGANQRWTISAQ